MSFLYSDNFLLFEKAVERGKIFWKEATEGLIKDFFEVVPAKVFDDILKSWKWKFLLFYAIFVKSLKEYLKLLKPLFRIIGLIIIICFFIFNYSRVMESRVNIYKKPSIMLKLKLDDVLIFVSKFTIILLSADQIKGLNNFIIIYKFLALFTLEWINIYIRILKIQIILKDKNARFSKHKQIW